MAQEKFTFQAEVSKLLDIVAHSLYSHKEIFLRELISNASDACDRLRYAALTDAALTGGDADFKITLSVDKKANTLTVTDNGDGMNRDDLTEVLGTIARSGTQAFVDQMAASTKDTGKKKGKDAKGGDDMALIGQFGVGFYSTFMVADKVEVLTRKAGDKKAWNGRRTARANSLSTKPNATRGAPTSSCTWIKRKKNTWIRPASNISSNSIPTTSAFRSS